MFEGIALGSRLGAAYRGISVHMHIHGHGQGHGVVIDETAEESKTPLLSKRKTFLMALAFALITPIGMAIGIGVLSKFNGNDPSTLVAIGTLDAFSAGILVWVGLVEMWAKDWTGVHAEMNRVSTIKKVFGLISLVTGMAVMSLLGKWA